MIDENDPGRKSVNDDDSDDEVIIDLTDEVNIQPEDENRVLNLTDDIADEPPEVTKTEDSSYPESDKEVLAFDDGVKALKSIQENLPDLALLDNHMPEMTGLEVCRIIKGDEHTRFIPVVIVTGLDSEQDELYAIEAGADDFISKPFNSVILLTRVRSLMRIKHLHDELENRNKLLGHVLTRYVAKEIADTVLSDPERHLKLGGEIRDVTIFFADLRDFTPFSASHSPTQVVESLNLIFNEFINIIFEY